LSSVYLALLARFVRRGQGREIWWLVPLMALWVNLHGGFLMGLVLIGLTIVGIPLDAWANGKKFSSAWQQVRTLSIMMVGCLLAVLLNPHGVRIYKFPFEIFMSPVQQQAIVDWFSPNFHQSEAVPLMLLLFLTIAALALSPKRVRMSQLLLLLSTLYFNLKSQRHVAIFALVATPMVADYLQSWITEKSHGKMFSVSPSDAAPKSRMPLLLAVLFLVPVVAFAAKLKATVFDEWRQEVLKVPLNAVAHIKEQKISGNTFTDPNIWGGLVIWATPSNRVYIDGRIDMYGDDFVKEYLNIIWGTADWREPFDRYGVRIVIVEPTSTLSRELGETNEWSRVFQDEMAVVFVRS